MPHLPISVLAIIVIMCCNEVYASDNGWVLWEKEVIWYRGASPIKEESWDILDAFETHKECSDDKKDTWNAALKAANEEKKEGAIADVHQNSGVLTRVMKKEDTNNIVSWSHKFYCLPGTLDPRNKK